MDRWDVLGLASLKGTLTSNLLVLLTLLERVQEDYIIMYTFRITALTVEPEWYFCDLKS